MAGFRAAHPRKRNVSQDVTWLPSLTSRGRLLTSGVEVLIRTSNDEGRVGRRYGIRMKYMTTGLYPSLPSLGVPVREGQKRRLVLWEIEMVEMTADRYRELDKAGKGITLEESAAGWHFCEEWDQMLVGPGMPEMECCNCLND